jgi:hypothetical protein
VQPRLHQPEAEVAAERRLAVAAVRGHQRLPTVVVALVPEVAGVAAGEITG